MNKKLKIKYYRVEAKCGHVGRNNFYLGAFFIKAESGEDAAKKVKQYPRVKHHHKDAIRSVQEIDYQIYLKGYEEYKNNPYFVCHNKQEQKCCQEIIQDNIHEDGRNTRGINMAYERTGRYSDITGREAKRLVIERVDRKMRKYGLRYEQDYFGIDDFIFE